MFAIFRKEITGFFSSLTGYIVIIFFLLINSLFMWVLPGEWNIFDGGYAGLDTLFILSPWIFMFLVPAVTMRMIAEEKRLGTIELIFSRPVSEREIVYGKYFASLALVLLALLPGIIYYISVWNLGATPGNLDKGGTMGAFIGLFFLAAVYASAGVFASSLTDNQVIAFIIAVTVCFLLFIGFDSFAYLPGLKKIDEVVMRLGINEHYKSISRGVIDLRDIFYFIAVIAVFNEFTVFKLQSHRWTENKSELRNWLRLILTLSAVIIIASASMILRLRADLTEDNRYTLSAPTRKILSEIKNDIYVQVYLEGDIPIPLKRLKRSVTEMLDEFRIASGRKIDFEFINPSEGKNAEERNTLYQSLAKKGLIPVNLQSGDTEGGSSQKIIFPGMIVNYNGIEVPVNFLKNNPSIPYELNILHSEEGLEYEMIQTISTLSSDTIYKVAFLEGHGEIPEIGTADITYNLAKFFTIDRGVIGGKTGVLDNYAAVVIAGPEREFSEADKLVLDQYIMNGGKVMWLFEEVYVSSDSLASGETVGLYRPLNLEDQLFRYGARVNPAIIQDLDCMVIRLKVAGAGTNPQYVPAPWVYYPKLHPSQNHPITRNINKVKGEFVNYIDTVGLDGGIKKTILLTSSELSKTLNPPVLISLREAELIPKEEEYKRSSLPVAVLLEGLFPSAFKGRPVGAITTEKNLKVKTISNSNRMIVIADGDIIRNEVSHSGLQETPVPLGQDKYTGEVFGNRDFLINCLNYLVDDKGILELRSRELKLRLLNTKKVKSEKVLWQVINVAGPVLLVLIAGFLYGYFRRRKYSGVRSA
jgi:ABC-2 type transport system permease protein